MFHSGVTATESPPVAYFGWAVSVLERRLNMFRVLTTVFFLLCAEQALAQSPASTDVAGTTPGLAESTAKRYSPFAIQVDGLFPFDVVTVQDVGLHLAEGLDHGLYEAISQALSITLGSSEFLEVTANVSYVEDIADPSRHEFCDSDHLYVALWHGTHPDKWGFSLWSGCGELDEFAWHEFESDIDSGEIPFDSIERLASEIVSAVENAARTQCFQKRC